MVKYFGKNLRFLRKKMGLNQTQLSDLVRKAHTTIGNWENDVSEPNFTELIEILNIFEIGAHDLLYKDLENAYLNQENGTQKNQQESIPKSIPNSIPNYSLSVAAEPPNHYGNVPQVVTVDVHGDEKVALVPVKARAGYLLGYGDAEYISNLPVYSLPGLKNGTYRMFEVNGYSMHPTFTEKDIVVCQFVENTRFLRNERVYVVITREHGIVIKRLLNTPQEPNKLVLSSDNNIESNNYPPIVIELSEILEIWQFKYLITENISNGPTHNIQLADINARLTLLEEKLSKSTKK